MDPGIGPDKEFDDKDRFFKETMSPNELGITPIMLFDEKFKTLRFFKRVNDVGIIPFSLFFEKSIWVSFGFQSCGRKPVKYVLVSVIVFKDFMLEVMMWIPEALMGSPEMYR